MGIGAVSVIGGRGQEKGKMSYTASGRRVEGNRLGTPLIPGISGPPLSLSS